MVDDPSHIPMRPKDNGSQISTCMFKCGCSNNEATEVLIHPCPELSFFLQLPELIVEFQTSLPLYMTLFCQYLPAFSHRKPLFMLQSPSPL